MTQVNWSEDRVEQLKTLWTEGLSASQIARASRDVSDTDAQGRLLRYVYVGDTFVNSALVQAGAARVRFEQPDVRFAQDFVALQTTAQQARAGLWGACP
mgnify:CR=1 FL=1